MVRLAVARQGEVEYRRRAYVIHRIDREDWRDDLKAGDKLTNASHQRQVIRVAWSADGRLAYAMLNKVGRMKRAGNEIMVARSSLKGYRVVEKVVDGS